MSSGTQRSSCPCKNLTWSLSSFTAAEYGDVSALTRALDKSSSSRNTTSSSDTRSSLGTGGITPLHLAAQHGHVAATWLLLEQGHYVDGERTVVQGNHGTNESPSKKTCTPLHRASFSGAVATMKLLLEQNANLLARDESFGDRRTPLHKASAGGRYLAVALLLDTMRSNNLLSEGVMSLDQNQQTPLQISNQIQSQNPEQERQSVARWDVVAGGSADWDKCIALLTQAEEELNNKAANEEEKKSDEGSTQQRNTPVASNLQGNLKNLPRHRFAEVDCLDCEGNGECVTATWSAAFQNALQQSVLLQQSLKSTVPDAEEKFDSKKSANDQEATGAGISVTKLTTEPVSKQMETPLPHNVPPPTNTTSEIGRSCQECGKHTLVLFPLPDDGGLVCKKCRPKRRR